MFLCTVCVKNKEQFVAGALFPCEVEQQRCKSIAFNFKRTVLRKVLKQLELVFKNCSLSKRRIAQNENFAA